MMVSLFYFLLPQFFNVKNRQVSEELKQIMASMKIDSLRNSYGSKRYSYKDDSVSAKLTPFSFDPNTLDETGFRRLGLRDKLIHTLLNYRNKGGKFYNKESLKRIYGLHDNEYAQLEAYINIPSSYKNEFNTKPKEVLHIELNTADTSALIKLRGIGSKLSMNIIKLREQLGGFARVEQLKEVYGISEETFQLIRSSVFVNTSQVKKLNLNAATFYELNAHPYLKGEIAKAFVEYRKLHNYKIENLNQIKEITLINEEIFRKIVPYLRIQ